MIPQAIHKKLYNSEKSKGGVLKSTFAEDFPLNILIAEDDFINQKLIDNILRKLGYRTDAVTNGIQVLDLMKKKASNVILMDVHMPEMGGFETTRIIRKKTIEQPYIIAMTANSMPGDRDDCLNMGMNDYVSKPIYMAEIIKALKNAAAYITEKHNTIFIN